MDRPIRIRLGDCRASLAMTKGAVGASNLYLYIGIWYDRAIHDSYYSRFTMAKKRTKTKGTKFTVDPKRPAFEHIKKVRMTGGNKYITGILYIVFAIFFLMAAFGIAGVVGQVAGYAERTCESGWVPWKAIGLPGESCKKCVNKHVRSLLK